MFRSACETLSTKARELVESVYHRYNSMSSWKLSTLSHGELSWRCAREGLAAKENGTTVLSLADMRVDAARELLRRKRANTTL